MESNDVKNSFSDNLRTNVSVHISMKPFKIHGRLCFHTWQSHDYRLMLFLSFLKPNTWWKIDKNIVIFVKIGEVSVICRNQYFEIEVHFYKTYFGENISWSIKSTIIGTAHNEEKTGSELCYGISATKIRISVPNITDSFDRSVKHAMFWVTWFLILRFNLKNLKIVELALKYSKDFEILNTRNTISFDFSAGDPVSTNDYLTTICSMFCNKVF